MLHSQGAPTITGDPLKELRNKLRMAYEKSWLRKAGKGKTDVLENKLEEYIKILIEACADAKLVCVFFAP